MNNLNSCYDCIWSRNDERHLHRTESGIPEPVYDEPTDCEDFAEERFYENQTAHREC